MDLGWPDDEMCPYCKRQGVERAQAAKNVELARLTDEAFALRRQVHTLGEAYAELEDYIRELACSLSVGGFNAPTFNLETFRRKIADGLDMLVFPWARRATGAEIALGEALLKRAEAENAVKQLQAELGLKADR
jgi:hypothetical protein